MSNTGSATLNVSSVTAGGVFSVLSPAAPFTVAPGAATAVSVQFSPSATGGQASTLNIVSNDPVQPNLTVPIWGTGYSPANVLVSDSFKRANATECSLGPADLKFGGSGAYYYLPDWPGSGGPVGAGIISGALQNNGLDFGGVQLTASSDTCGSAQGAALPQDLDIIVDLYVPGSSGKITDAGAYFRSRSAAPGDGLFGGTSSGYWVELFSTGEAWVDQLNPFEPIAKTAVPASFNPNVVHTLETLVQGTSLQVTLDGNPQTFTQNGAAVTTVAVPTASNNGAVGISFGSERNRGKAGGQTASNLVISSAGSGSSPAPQISVLPASLSFGNVTVGQSSTMTLTITNQGGATLNVTSLGVAGPFAIVSPNTPFTVAAGASATVTISFTAVAGPQSATLTIASNDPANPSVSVAVTGNGAAPGVSAAGLIGYWPFEGNGQDASGNGYDLTLEGGAMFGQGISGQALRDC